MIEAEFELLRRINAEVNNEITYTPDMVQYGVADKWVYNPPSLKGDCEDYALTKLYRLVKAGFPANRCAVYLCWTNTGTYHAVLVVDDKYVLENGINYIQLWIKMGYTFDRALRPRLK